MTLWTFLFTAAFVAGQFGGFAAPVDPRIRTVTYDTGQVVSLPVSTGYAAVIEFGPDEQVDSVVVGDPTAWQVTLNKRGDHVVVKPLDNATTTDMVVITADRRYVFLLQPANGGTAPFLLRFVYPDAAPATATTIAAGAIFRFQGAQALFPVAMRDDGRRTTINWGRNTALPAIFAIGPGGREALVNGRMVGSDYVIEGTAPRYVFRSGKAHAVAVRLSASASK